jgi:predicted pyridoxine 5'-phosphate oxidase superfamily flavin-nucleotide-binding protein
MAHTIEQERQLRALIGSPAAILEKRIQPRLDSYCLELIAQAKLMVIASAGACPELQPIALASAHFSVSASELRFHLPVTATSVSERQNGSAYFMVPGVGHALRVNGLLQHDGNGYFSLQVQSAYMHCSRAAVRSALWQSPGRPDKNSERCLTRALEKARFALLKTCDADGVTSISPRGDDQQVMHRLEDGRLFLPERPGNKVALSLRNLLHNPELELLLYITGSDELLHIRGTAQLSNNPQWLTRCAVNDKLPRLGIVISVQQQQWQPAQAFTQAIRHAERYGTPSVTPFAKALSAHMQGEGLLGKATHLVVDRVVKHDLKNLY